MSPGKFEPLRHPPACAGIGTLTFTHTHVEALGGAKSQSLEAIKQ